MSIKKVFVISIVAVILTASASIYFIVLPKFNSPAVGNQANTAIIQDNSSSKHLVFDFTPKTLAGTYISFAYPASLQVTHNSKLVGPVMEMHNLTYPDVQTWLLAVAVLNIPSGRLQDNSTYMFAKTKSDTYKETQTIINSQPVIIFTDTTVGGFKEVAILVHGGRQATISLYGDDESGTDKLEQTFNMVLSTWQWLAT